MCEAVLEAVCEGMHKAVPETVPEAVCELVCEAVLEWVRMGSNRENDVDFDMTRQQKNKRTTPADGSVKNIKEKRNKKKAHGAIDASACGVH